MPPKRNLSDRFASGGSKRRRPAQRVPNVPALAPVDGPVDAPTPSAAARPAAAAPRSVSTFAARRQAAVSHVNRQRVSPLHTDFDAVRNDLKRISVLAGAAAVILLALTFVVR